MGQSVLDIFKGEKFLLIVGENIKKPNRGRNNMDPRENCHVILHKDATNMDIVKSTLAIGVLRRSLYKQYHKKNENDKFSSNTIPVMRTQDYLPLLQLSKVIADEWFLRFLKILQVRGWATPAKYMFGKVTIRADWPISESNGKRSKNTTLAKSSRHSNDSSEVVMQMERSHLRHPFQMKQKKILLLRVLFDKNPFFSFEIVTTINFHKESFSRK